MKLLPAIVAALVLAAGVAHADTLTPRAFTERVARATHGGDALRKVAVNGDLQFVVRYANGASAASDLTKALQELRARAATPRRYRPGASLRAPGSGW